MTPAEIRELRIKAGHSMLYALDAARRYARTDSQYSREVTMLSLEDAAYHAQMRRVLLLLRETLDWYATGNGTAPHGHCGDYGVRAREALGKNK